MIANYNQNRDRFDKDIAKIKQCSFLPHMVVLIALTSMIRDVSVWCEPSVETKSRGM